MNTKEYLKIEHLCKAYSNKIVVNNLSFSLKKGEVLGLLGPNGAGKSTTISMISTLLPADSGAIFYFGLPIKDNETKIKRRIGIVPQDLAIYEELSAYKNVTFFASLYGLKGETLELAVKTALEIVGLFERKDDKAKTYSGGMKRRLNIACAIAHQPDIIILDEPTVGIDSQSRNYILAAIKKMSLAGTAIIYTTHYMEEVEAICDRIIIIDHGEKIAEGTMAELFQSYEQTTQYEVLLEEELSEELIAVLQDITWMEEIKVTGNSLVISVKKDAVTMQTIFDTLNKYHCLVTEFCKKKVNLEMIFLDLTGRALRD